MDLSRLSDADLLALKAGDLSKVSDEGLMLLKAQSSAPLPAALDEPAAPPPKPAQNATGVTRQLGLFARAIPESIANTAAAFIGNPAVAAWNMATGDNREYPSQTYSRALDQVFPRPETKIERFANPVAQAMFGTAAQAAVAQAAAPISELGKYVAKQFSERIGPQISAAATGAGAAQQVQENLPDTKMRPYWATVAGMVAAPFGAKAFDAAQSGGRAVADRIARMSGTGPAKPPVEMTGVDLSKIGGALRAEIDGIVESARAGGSPVDQVQLKNYLALREAGVPREAITRAMVTRDPMAWQQEARLQKMDEIGRPLLESYKSADDSIKSGIRALEDRAQPLTPEGFGKTLKSAVGDEVGRLKADRTRAYQVARSQPEVQSGVPIDGIKQWLNSQENFFSVKPELKVARDEILRMAGDLPAMKIDNLETLRQGISALRKPDGSNAGTIGQIVGQLDDAVLNAGKGAPFEDARFAHSIYKATSKDQGIIGDLIGTKPGTIDPKVSADQVYSKIVASASTSADQLRQVVNTLRVAGDEKPIVQMRAQIIDDLATTLSPNSDGGSRPAMFARKMTALQDKLPVLFSPEEVSQLQAAQRAAELVMTDVGRSAVNKSNTGNEIASMVRSVMNVPGVRQLNWTLGNAPGFLAESMGKGADAIRNQRQVSGLLSYSPTSLLGGQPVPSGVPAGILGAVGAVPSMMDEDPYRRRR